MGAEGEAVSDHRNRRTMATAVARWQGLARAAWRRFGSGFWGERERGLRSLYGRRIFSRIPFNLGKITSYINVVVPDSRSVREGMVTADPSL